MESLAATQFGFAPALASALLHSLWQDTLLAVAAAFALAALARRSAALRHTVAMGFLAAMVVVPTAGFLRFWDQAVAEVNGGLLPAMTAPTLDATAHFVQESSTAAAVVAMLWVAGVALMLARHVSGLGFVRKMERNAFETLPPHWQRRVEELRVALGITRAVSVRLSREVLAPFTARLIRPVVWLPLSLLMRVPPEQLEALLAHELAHIARKDWLWNGLQCVLESLLFFHPAAWWLSRRIRQEREHACDDLAVMACGDAIALAEALESLERQRHFSPHLVLAAQGGSLMQRITRLLSAPPSRGRWGAIAALGVLLTAGAVFVAQMGFAGNWHPQLHIRSTASGPLGPGDDRQITTNGVDGERFYKASVDAQGRLTEIYKKNGKVLPIDADARRWLAEIERLSTPPIPPVPPMPPPPPAPPSPPNINDSAEFKALLGVIAADPRVSGRVGTPVVATSDVFNGNLRVDGSEGDADLRIPLKGPKGRMNVDVVATRHDGRWTISSLDVQ